MVQRRHLWKYIGLILPFRKSISHISFFAQKKPDRKQTSQSASCPAAISSNSSPSEQGILYHTRAPAQDCQAWLSRRGASGSQTVGPVAISALGDNDILCDQFIQIIPCA